MELLLKTVIDCKDTPGFIGNRIGVFWMMSASLKAIEMGLSVEEADTIISSVFASASQQIVNPVVPMITQVIELKIEE